MEQHKPVANIDKKREAFARALGVMQTLRSDCPWDAKQDNESIRQNTIEETYELAEALIKGDAKEIQKECGDVLGQELAGFRHSLCRRAASLCRVAVELCASVPRTNG